MTGESAQTDDQCLGCDGIWRAACERIIIGAAGESGLLRVTCGGKSGVSLESETLTGAAYPTSLVQPDEAWV